MFMEPDSRQKCILRQYREALPVFEKMKEIVRSAIGKQLENGNLYVNAVELRIKSEESLRGKLERKGDKYGSMEDVTDILGARVITFYTDDVDKIAALMDRTFDIDWQESVDKRREHGLHSFGYRSLHYVCRIPVELYRDPDLPEINEYRFELQMRTALEHVWSTLDHDICYKNNVEIPVEYRRNLNRLAGVLELADEQFSRIRTELTDYSRKVQNLINDGSFYDIPLNEVTFTQFLTIHPFESLVSKIAAVNQAEILESNLMPYLKVMRQLNFTSLGDIEKMIKKYSDAAYELAAYELGNTDIDIISSTVAVQDLLIVHILKHNGGEEGLVAMFDALGGDSEYNAVRAGRVARTAAGLKFMSEVEI